MQVVETSTRTAADFCNVDRQTCHFPHGLHIADRRWASDLRLEFGNINIDNALVLQVCVILQKLERRELRNSPSVRESLFVRIHERRFRSEIDGHQWKE